VPAASPFIQYDGNWSFSANEASFRDPSSSTAFSVTIDFVGSGVSISGDSISDNPAVSSNPDTVRPPGGSFVLYSLYTMLPSTLNSSRSTSMDTESFLKTLYNQARMNYASMPLELRSVLLSVSILRQATETSSAPQAARFKTDANANDDSTVLQTVKIEDTGGNMTFIGGAAHEPNPLFSGRYAAWMYVQWFLFKISHTENAVGRKVALKRTPTSASTVCAWSHSSHDLTDSILRRQRHRRVRSYLDWLSLVQLQR
jgi:hypothetical protein